MADTPALEKALQATVERLVESRLALLRAELSRDLQGEISAALGGSGGGAAAGPTLSALNQCVTRILQPTAQSDVMAASLQSAARFAGRCVLFVRRGDAFGFWRAEGFAPDAAASLRSFSASADERGIFKDVTDTQLPLSTKLREAVPAALNQALGDIAGGLYLFPVVVQGKVVAALFADAGSRAGTVEPAALEILARVTGLSLETVAQRAGGQAARPAAAVGAQAEPSSTTSAGEGPEQTPAAFAEPAGTSSAAQEQTGPPPGSFAASIPAATAGTSDLEPPPVPDSLADAERDAHRKAHRFARVAVQDLLSYHKAKIEQGREKKNLYMMLKEDIEKTRENYQKRFGETPARSFDYLHYELVLKLAGNDPAALGSQYPGRWEAR